MSSTQSQIRHIDKITNELLGDSYLDFLRNLGGPAWIQISGKDSRRRRAIVTLLHGNEPSGLKAVYHLLVNEVKPEVDVGILVAGVDAALYPPVLSHRYMPEEQDLNRCFAPPYNTPQAKLAQNILKTLNDFAPEAVIDTHNTSGSSDIFCVAVQSNSQTAQLAGLFCQHVVVIQQSLGTLMEHLDSDIPAITVEFGAFADPRADELAVEKITQLVTSQDIFCKTPANRLRNPLRLETRADLRIGYGSGINDECDLTMVNTIDRLNFQNIKPGTLLGWHNTSLSERLVAEENAGIDRFDDFFDASNGLLTNRVALTLFMATTDPVVAATDCLLYFTRT